MATYPEVRDVVTAFAMASLSGLDQIGLNAFKPGLLCGQEFVEDFMQTESLRDLEMLKYAGINALLDLQHHRKPKGRFATLSLPELRSYVKISSATVSVLTPLFCADECYTEAEQDKARRLHRVVDRLTEQSWITASAIMARAIPSRKTGPA